MRRRPARGRGVVHAGQWAALADIRGYPRISAPLGLAGSPRCPQEWRRRGLPCKGAQSAEKRSAQKSAISDAEKKATPCAGLRLMPGSVGRQAAGRACAAPRLLPLSSADVARPSQDLRRLSRAVLKHLRRLHLRAGARARALSRRLRLSTAFVSASVRGFPRALMRAQSAPMLAFCSSFDIVQNW